MDFSLLTHNVQLLTRWPVRVGLAVCGFLLLWLVVRRYHCGRRCDACESDDPALQLSSALQEVALFRHLLDQVSEIIFIVDPANGTISDVNASACMELGYMSHELIGKHAGSIFAGWQDDLFAGEESEKYGSEIVMNGELSRHDKTSFPVEISLKNIDLVERRCQLAVASKVSFQDGVAHSQKEMAGGEQLSAGFANEINNPASCIISNLSTMGDYVQDISRLLTEYRNFVRMVDVEGELLQTKHIELTSLEDAIEGGYLLRDMRDVVSDSLKGAEQIQSIVQGAVGKDQGL